MGGARHINVDGYIRSSNPGYHFDVMAICISLEL